MPNILAFGDNGGVALLDFLNLENALMRPRFNLADSANCLASIDGVGIHTGHTFRLKLFRNSTHRSLIFKVHLDDDCFFAPASWSRLSGTARATALVLRSDKGRASGRLELKTVEHFLAAFHVSGLRGFDVELEILEKYSEAPSRERIFELPILDGASMDWMNFFAKAQLMEAGAHRASEGDLVWKIIRSYEVADGNRKIMMLPSSGATRNQALTEFFCSVDFPDQWQQQCDLKLDWNDISANIKEFSQKIARARTFGFQEELVELEKRGLARGGNMGNALLLSREKVINPEGFCVPNELAAHKLLDLVGDFALSGGPILGQIHANCAGHSMHLRALTESIRKGVLVQGIIDRQGRFHRRD